MPGGEVEEVERRYEQLLLHHGITLQQAPQARRRRDAARLRCLYGQVEGVLQTQVAYVSDEDAAISDRFERLLQHSLEVFGRREILDHRVDDDCVHREALFPGYDVAHAVGPHLEHVRSGDGVSREPVAQPRDCGRREVDAEVTLRVWRDPGHYEAGPAPYLEDRSWMELEYAVYGRVDPLAHLFFRYGRPVVRAVPARGIEGVLAPFAGAALEQLVVDRLPRRDRLCRGLVHARS